MYLYHAFPRPRSKNDQATGWRDHAESILDSILAHGFLCTPERLDIYPDLHTDYIEKRRLLALRSPEVRHVQSRVCFTLCNTNELYAKSVRGLSPSTKGPEFLPGEVASHSDLFGPIAVAIEPITSRRLGIVPTSYYSPNDVFGDRYQGGASKVPGLNYQIISRLKELREVLIVIAFIESGLTISSPLSKKRYTFPEPSQLAELGYGLPFNRELIQRLKGLSKSEKLDLFSFFDLDRDPAFNLVGFVDMMLNLFQQSDSSLNDDIFAFFQQREFRLIHHMRKGSIWYSLGKHPEFLNPLFNEKYDEIKAICAGIEKVRGEKASEDYLKHCWLFESIDGRHSRNCIHHVVAPHRDIAWIESKLKSYSLNIQVLKAEKYGFSRE